MLSLFQKVSQMTLKSATAESSCSKIEGIDLPPQVIVRLSANGPPKYRNEASKIGALRNAIVSEEWNLSAIVDCQKDPQEALEYYVSQLTPYLRTCEGLRKIRDERTMAPTLNFDDDYE